LCNYDEASREVPQREQSAGEGPQNIVYHKERGNSAFLKEKGGNLAKKRRLKNPCRPFACWEHVSRLRAITHGGNGDVHHGQKKRVEKGERTLNSAIRNGKSVVFLVFMPNTVQSNQRYPCCNVSEGEGSWKCKDP